jgi:hypothetical protein
MERELVAAKGDLVCARVKSPFCARGYSDGALGHFHGSHVSQNGRWGDKVEWAGWGSSTFQLAALDDAVERFGRACNAAVGSQVVGCFPIILSHGEFEGFLCCWRGSDAFILLVDIL